MGARRGGRQELQNAIAGKPSAPTWPDACRDVELTESIARSLAKGRTIELHDEEHSEHGTFKGTMTSLGCGLLLASLLLLPVAAVLAKLTNNAFFGYAPYLILGVLGVFLVLQSLKLVFPRTMTGNDSAPTSMRRPRQKRRPGTFAPGRFKSRCNLAAVRERTVSIRQHFSGPRPAFAEFAWRRTNARRKSRRWPA